ncbi:tetratricopeptide repeat protein [Ethanoligenens sp.]|uniref:tetratricopeptide repeat protein n=1 Tax=Ethanoligenens sp. TaxID=2099655 RepID=UPI0039EC1E4D
MSSLYKQTAPVSNTPPPAADLKRYTRIRLFADAGRASAQYLLAKMLVEGNGVQKNVYLADEYFVKAFRNSLDNADIMANTVRNPDLYDALEYGEVLSGAAACYRVGRMYENGEGCFQDIDKAVEYYEVAAKLRHVPAEYRLWRLLGCKAKTYSNFEQGHAYLKDAAMGGSLAATYEYGRLLLIHIDNDSKKYGLYLVQRAAKHGYAKAVDYLKQAFRPPARREQQPRHSHGLER